MKRGILIGYGVILTVTVMLQSCDDGPIIPITDPNNGTDTTWVNDSIGDPNEGGNGDPVDSTDWNGGNGDPIDSTDWNGGNGDPTDTIE